MIKLDLSDYTIKLNGASCIDCGNCRFFDCRKNICLLFLEEMCNDRIRLRACLSYAATSAYTSQAIKINDKLLEILHPDFNHCNECRFGNDIFCNLFVEERGVDGRNYTRCRSCRERAVVAKDEKTDCVYDKSMDLLKLSIPKWAPPLHTLTDAELTKLKLKKDNNKEDSDD